MRISDWSSDVCSSDLIDRTCLAQELCCNLSRRETASSPNKHRFTHSGAVAIAQDDDADDIVRRGFELPRFGPQGEMDRILGQRHRNVVGWKNAAGGTLRLVVALSDTNDGRLVLEVNLRARLMRQLQTERHNGVLNEI